MWIKKTNKEIEAYRKKAGKSLLVPLAFSLTFLIGEILFYRFPPVCWEDPKPPSFFVPLTWKEILYNKLPESFLIAFVIFILLYIAQRKDKKNIYEEKSFICVKCNKLIGETNKTTCECGGEYIDINEMRWIDDELDSKNNEQENSVENQAHN